MGVVRERERSMLVGVVIEREKCVSGCIKEREMCVSGCS